MRIFIASLLAVRVIWASVVTPPLLELLDLTQVSHDGTLASIVEGTQKKWLRPAGKERWETTDLDADKRVKVLELAEQIGFIDEVRPTETQYDYVLLLGATVFRMEARLNYMVKLWKEGVQFKHVVILTGMRPLDTKVEQKIADTESEAARILWSECELNFLPVSFIEAPMNGSLRPTTQDTIIAWQDEFPEPGRCLFISNQPYCFYQGAVVDLNLSDEFPHETVGEAANPSKLNAAVVLDSIARWLYSSDLSSRQ